MKESIHIKNLGPIKDIHIEDIKSFTVFIGKSGSGKSTLMKTIALFRWIYKMHNIRSYLKHSKISKSPFRFRMDSYLKDTGLEQFINDETEITYIANMPSQKTYKIKFDKKGLSGTTDKELIAENDLSFLKISFISETRNIIPLWAVKGASLAGVSLGFYFHEVYNDFNLASDTVKEVNMDFLDLKFAVKKVKGEKKYSIQSTKENGYEIDFKNSSSGTQTAAPISLLAQYFSQHFSFEDAFNRSVLKYLSTSDSLTDFKPVKNLSELTQQVKIHIEEPELSLYPDAQRELINDVVKKCFNNNKHTVELLFSTHSPYIINHINLLIKAYDTNQPKSVAQIDFKDLAVYQVVDGKIFDLKTKNERLINTNPLSETINDIYEEYKKLG